MAGEVKIVSVLKLGSDKYQFKDNTAVRTVNNIAPQNGNVNIGAQVTGELTGDDNDILWIKTAIGGIAGPLADVTVDLSSGQGDINENLAKVVTRGGGTVIGAMLAMVMLSCTAYFSAFAAHVYPENPSPDKGAFFGQLNRDNWVSTNSQAGVIEETDPTVNHRANWNRSGAWVISYLEVPTERETYSSYISTNSSCQVLSNYNETVAYGLSAYCYQEVHDKYIIGVPWIESWDCLTPGGTITDSGIFTAVSNGAYRISATDTQGSTRLTDVHISGQHTNSVTVSSYYDDALAVRKAVNDRAYADLMSATFVKSNQQGRIWYNVWTTPTVNFDSLGSGNVVQFPVSAHVLASANHYPDWCKWKNQQTFGNVTVTKTNWISLADWALKNGWNEIEVAEMTLGDIDLILCDDSAGVPDNNIPYLMTESTCTNLFGESLIGIQAWMSPQDIEYSLPVTINSSNHNIMWRLSVNGEIYNGTTWRCDVFSRLNQMGHLYNPYTGDSGRPVYAIINDKPVILSSLTYTSSGPNYMKAFPAIKKFVEMRGDTIKELKR